MTLIALADEPTTVRKGLRVRTLDDGRRSVVEVAEPGELERLRDAGDLTPRQYEAGLALRDLWHEGTLLAEPSSSGLTRLEDPYRRPSPSDISDHRLEANDLLRSAVRALGPARDWIIQVAIYDAPVKSGVGIRLLRRGLDRLAGHLMLWG